MIGWVLIRRLLYLNERLQAAVRKPPEVEQVQCLRRDVAELSEAVCELAEAIYSNQPGVSRR